MDYLKLGLYLAIFKILIVGVLLGGLICWAIFGPF